MKKNGRIIIGIVDRESFLGRFYKKKKSIFYTGANFLSVQEITAMIKEAGFRKINYYQTVFNLPGMMDKVQQTHRGYGAGGFVVISGEKA